MFPGDLIEWCVESTGDVVERQTNLRSSIHRSWVPISPRSLLVAVDAESYSWWSSDGLLSAKFKDTALIEGNVVPKRVLPRAMCK